MRTAKKQGRLRNSSYKNKQTNQKTQVKVTRTGWHHRVKGQRVSRLRKQSVVLSIKNEYNQKLKKNRFENYLSVTGDLGKNILLPMFEQWPDCSGLVKRETESRLIFPDTRWWWGIGLRKFFSKDRRDFAILLSQKDRAHWERT